MTTTTRLYEDEFDGSPVTGESSLMMEPSSTGGGIGIAPQPSSGGQAGGAEGGGEKPGVWESIKESFGPVRLAKQSRLREREAQTEELKSHVNALEQGVKLLQGLEGGEREAFKTSYKDRLEKLSPGLGATFESVAARPSLIAEFEKYMPHLPEPLKVLAKRDPKAFLHYVGTADGQKALIAAQDQPNLRTATQKIQILRSGWQQVVPEEMRDLIKDGLTASDVMAVQSHLPKALQFSESELDAVRRNDKMVYSGTGVLHGEGESKVIEARAKRAGEPAKAPQTLTVDGKVFQFDPDKKIGGTRHKTDARYVEMGASKSREDGEPSQNDIVNREFRLSDDYRADTKKFAERRPLFDSSTSYMAERGQNKTSAGDASLMFAYAKMRDPNDRLAVSETRDLVKLGNIFERFGVSVKGVISEGETLPDRVANQMYDEIRRSFTEQNRQQLKVEADYRKKTTDYKGNPERVVRGYAIPENELNPPKDKAKDKEPSQADLEFTAIKHGITVEEVKKRIKAGKQK